MAEGLKNPVGEHALESATADGAVDGGDDGGRAKPGGSPDTGSLEVASEDGSAETGTINEHLHTAQALAEPAADAERPATDKVGCVDEVAVAAALAPPAAQMGSSATARHGRANKRGRKGGGGGGSCEGEEHSTAAVIEAVSFATLPTKSIKVPGAGVKAGRTGEKGTGASAGAKGGQVFRQHQDASAQAQHAATAAPGDAALPGAATATMSAMFDTPIKRRPITVRKGAGGGVASLGGMFGEVTPAAITVVPCEIKANRGDDGHGACDVEEADAVGRDKRAEVAAAAAVLRGDANREQADGEDAGNAGASVEEEDLLSVRERYGQKRKSQAVLLGDVTTMKLSQKRGKATMLRLRNQVKQDGQAGPVQTVDADVEMFDYEAVLDGSDRLPSREGRGARGRGDRGGRRGRGDRGRRDPGRGGQQMRRVVRGDEHKSSKRAGIFEGRKSGAWNPYAIEAEKSMGKRSGRSAPKSANKSSNFRN